MFTDKTPVNKYDVRYLLNNYINQIIFWKYTKQSATDFISQCKWLCVIAYLHILRINLQNVEWQKTIHTTTDIITHPNTNQPGNRHTHAWRRKGTQKKTLSRRRRSRSEGRANPVVFIFSSLRSLSASCRCSSSICPGHNGLRQKQPEPAGKHKQGWTWSSQLTSCSSGVLGGPIQASYSAATSFKLPAHKNQSTAWQQRKSREKRTEKERLKENTIGKQSETQKHK